MVNRQDVTDVDGATQKVFDLTDSRQDLRIPESYDLLKSAIIDAATSKRVAQSPWQNRVEPLDVNNDGNVVPNDALRIINRLNGEGAGELPAQLEGSSFLDVTGENVVSARDVLQIVRHLNTLTPVTGSGEPAGEPPVAASSATASVDAYFAYAFEDSAADDDDDDDLGS